MNIKKKINTKLEDGKCKMHFIRCIRPCRQIKKTKTSNVYVTRETRRDKKQDRQTRTESKRKLYHLDRKKRWGGEKHMLRDNYRPQRKINEKTKF
jgi:hypothetical protein